MFIITTLARRASPARLLVAGILGASLALAGCGGGDGDKPAAQGKGDFTGAGATFPAPIYAKWGSAYRTATGNSLNYQAIGSGAGIAQIKARTVDFGATDAPMQPDELAKDGLVQFPAVIGALVVIVNLPGVGDGQLQLTAPLIADIYAGRINRWNDPAIVAVNPGVALKPVPITPVYRSDSSGTTAVFTGYMAKAAKNWTLGSGKTVTWPTGSGGKGNDGVAGNVKNSVGTIGYVEYNYAAANKLTMSRLANADGKFVAATPGGFLAAAGQVDWATAPGATADMLDLPGATSWPIVAATYILIPEKPARPAGARAALDFFAWAFDKGADTARDLGYVPLPAAAIARARAEWARIAAPAPAAAAGK